MNLRTKMQIAAILETVIEPSDDGYTYVDGWSDGRIAREVGCTPQLVVAVRKELHGPNFKARQQKTSRIAELERRIADLENDVRLLESRIIPQSLTHVETEPLSPMRINSSREPLARWDQSK